MPRAPVIDTSKLQTALPHVLLVVLIGLLLGLAELHGKLFRRLSQEDGWAEWATFAAFALAAYQAVTSARDRHQSGLSRFVLWGLAAFCVFVAGEEISWGQRLFGYRPPELFLEHNFQQEANLHNLLKDVLDTRFMVSAIALLYGVLLPFVCYVTRVPRVLAAPLALVPYFALVAWLELSYPYELIGEVAELLLGLLFVCDVAERSSSEQGMGRRASVMQVAALAGGALLLPMNDGLLQLHGQALAQTAHVELQHVAEQLARAQAKDGALLRKSHVHKRLYTAARAGYLQLPAHEYALDPWNSPYWIAFTRNDAHAGTLLVYSFGPNRKRDTDVDGASDGHIQLTGDDLGVLVSVAKESSSAP